MHALPPASIRLCTLGRLDVRGSEGTALQSVLQQPKRLALLIYLSTAAPRGLHRRDRLLALFWPELDEERARNNLSQAVHRLRRSLGEEVVISGGVDELGVDGGRLWCDAVAFDEMLGREQDEAALDLYGGTFLEGLGVEGAAPELEQWMDGERSRLRRLAVEAALRLSDAEEQAGNPMGAARWASRACEISPVGEAAVARLMDVLERQEDRAGAARVYHEFARRLAQEYDLEPSEELRLQFERIQAATARPTPPAASAAQKADAAPAAVAGDTRLIVLPFQMLRPDLETEFLSFSLPDAITASLAGLRSLVVRSNLAARRFGGEDPDLRAIAAEAGVDVVLTGNLLRLGEQLRLSCQLTNAADGTLLWSQTSQVSLRDLFELQDELTHRIVDSLALPLTARERRFLRHDLPTNGQAYELYLRANQVAYVVEQWTTARDLYLRCLEQEPNYAPAWARLGRCYHVIGKWAADEELVRSNLRSAEAAFRRALLINPHLPLAHNLYARLEMDLGRPCEAMVRLLLRAELYGGDAELFAGLVRACRLCGLLDPSLTAHDQARRLDPAITTSVSHTFFMRREYERVFSETFGDIGYIQPLALASLGRVDQALAALGEHEANAAEPAIQAYLASLRATLEDDRDKSVGACTRAAATVGDPEALFYLARQLARVGAVELAIAQLERALGLGFYCVPALQDDPWLDPLKDRPRFRSILEEMEGRQKSAAERFARAGGHELLTARVPTFTNEVGTPTSESQDFPAAGPA